MRIAFFSAALFASGIAVAATPIDGWYSSVFGGYTDIPDNLSTTRYGLSRNHSAYEPGYHAGGRLGFQSNPMRYEGEITYIESNLNTFFINGVRQTYVYGDTTAIVGMANIYYDFRDLVLPTIYPFVGLGLGFAYVDGDFKSRGPFGHTFYEGSNGVFAYQGTAGLTFNFAENYALNIAYRYVGTDRVHDLGRVFQANLATLGVIYRFNENGYK
ncbi:MAG: outer membrane beta-barrel protein [Legionella sp.]|nr:outer membrane beta-barrel protein [Legionella sp.]